MTLLILKITQILVDFFLPKSTYKGFEYDIKEILRNKIKVYTHFFCFRKRTILYVFVSFGSKKYKIFLRPTEVLDGWRPLVPPF